jgi:tetratricopeptide (TPR) repeat protein
MVLEISEEALGPNHLDVAAALDHLAKLYRVQGKYKEAMPLYSRALDIREKTLSPYHPDLGRSLSNLACL